MKATNPAGHSEPTRRSFRRLRRCRFSHQVRRFAGNSGFSAITWRKGTPATERRGHEVVNSLHDGTRLRPMDHGPQSRAAIFLAVTPYRSRLSGIGGPQHSHTLPFLDFSPQISPKFP